MEIKVCGIFREEDAGYINEAMPDYTGFVFFSKSHRNLSWEMAAKLRELLSPEIKTVGVFVNEPTENIIALLHAGVIDIAQLHGQESDDTVRQLKEATGKPVWKATKVVTREDVLRMNESSADEIILDNGYGTGESFDWTLLSEVKRPFFLAGGMTIEKVKQVLQSPIPYLKGVDISSGVETDKKKDREKICEVVQLVRSL